MIPAAFRLSARGWFIAGLIAAAWLAGRSCATPAPSVPSQVARAETVHVRAMAQTDTHHVAVTRWETRWRTDTAYRADTVTVRDTLRVLVPLAQFDSTIRACSELATSCERERVAAERLHRALRDSITALRPSTWDRVKGPVLFVGGVILGGMVAR